MTTLPGGTRQFLGMGDATSRDDFAERDPSFGRREADDPQRADFDAFDDRTRNERAAVFRAAAQELFRTDVSKLDDAGARGLYHAVTESMFGLADEDGSVAFGKRAAKDPRQNIEMLRKFVKGDYSLIEDPEYTKWRQMDDEAKFQYALENETVGNTIKSLAKGERGPSKLELVAHALTPAFMKVGPLRTEAERETQRKMRYEDLTDEEKERYRADVVADYDEKISRRQTLATFLQFSQGLSDRASWLLAKSFNDGSLDPQVMTMDDPQERNRVLSAFALMRGDQKSGTLLFVPTDFTDDTTLNRVQLGLYGLQQSVLGLATDTWGMAKDTALWTYAKTALSESERADFFRWWDAQARAEEAMKQPLPEAESFFGEAFQGVMENLHWFIPYGAIGKGGRMVNAARGVKGEQGILKGLATTLTPMRLGGTLKEEKAALEAGKAAMEAGAAATKAAWTLDVNGVKKLGEMGSAILARQMAAVDRYTQMLHGIDNDLKAAKWWKDAAGTGMWAAGEASAFSAFSAEYIANADAAGISREESVLTAAAIGLINAKIEQLYVPGLESSLSPAQIKSLTFAAMAQAIRSDGAAGFRKWLANRISYGAREGLKVAATEGVVEEPLQQMAIEHGRAFDKLCQELRKDSKATLANEAKALWDSFAATLPQDYATFIDTAVDMLPSSVGFGVTTIGNQTRRQHIHNVMTRHANRRAGSTSTMGTAQTMEELLGATDYDAGVVDMIQRAVDVRSAVEKQWQGEGGEEQKNQHRFEEAITAARQAFRNPQTGDVVGEVAQAAGVDVKTAEVLTQYLQVETEAAAFSPTIRAWTALNMSLADIDEQTIKTVLPGYVEGSFASDPEKGVYSGKVRLADGTERTIAYKVGDLSEELMAQAEAMAKSDSAYGKSFDARHAEIGDGVTWASLSDQERYMEAVRSQANVNGFSSGTSGVFELTDANGEKVRVNADDVIYLASGRIADIGYGPAATQGTVHHETFHALWRFVRASLDDADVQALAKSLGIDVTKDGWEVELDETMAHQIERYASGHHVSHAVSSRFDKMIDGWAGRLVNFFAQFGQRDEVMDLQTGKPYQLKHLYDRVLRGELGSGALGVELRKMPAEGTVTTGTGGTGGAAKSAMPVEVTDAERAAAEEELRQGADEKPGTTVTDGTTETKATPPVASVSPDESVPVATAEKPADASTPNQRYYRVGLPNSNVKLVGRLEVRDVETGVITSTDADYHDRGNQNRDDKSEESRALVEKIGANPDPLQVGTVQPIASNGIIWMLPNGDVIIGNHRVNGVRLGYAKGTTAELEKFVREDAAKRGIEIGADVKKPLMVFVLERIESPDGKADVHEVVRLANESQNRGFNIREQAANDAKILLDNNLLPRMAFRADGRIDETKSGDAIGKFRQETGAQGIIAEDGSLTEEGQTRLQNAALAALLGGEGNNALLNKIMTNAGRLDMQNELRALMKMTPELMSLAEAKPAYDLRAPLAEALQLFTEWRDKDEAARVEKGKTRHDWRETAKDGHRVRGISWEQFMSQGDMFRKPSDEAKILGDLFAQAEAERSFDREDVESAVGKKRAIDLISNYLTDYIENARAVNTETEDIFGGSPASRADVLAAQRATGGEGVGARFSIGGIYTGTAADYANRSRQGGVDDGPSLKKIGTGEGSQVYGWGLYGSTVRGVAEGYATPNHLTAEGLAANTLYQYYGNRNDAIEKLQKLVDTGSISYRKLRQDELERARNAISILKKHKEPSRHLYEQTFFTDRAPGDESHLLKWYDAISDANWDRVIAQAEKDGLRDKLKGAWWLRFNGDLEHFITDNGNSGDAIYERLSKLLGTPQAASEFLARAGIDGVKYPVDSYGGKTVKDGDKAGWNYVAFSDEHIRVDHKWTDGQQRYSIATLGNYNTGDLRDLAHRVKTGDAEAIAEAGRRLAGILPKNAVLVPMPSHTGEPTTMRDLASAIAANADGATVVDALRSTPHESNYEQKKRGETPAVFEMRRVADVPQGREVYIVDNVIDTGATYGAAVRAIHNAHILALADTDMTQKSRFSVETPRFRYPNPLNALSDEELIAAAIATRVALGKSEKFSDRALKINTVDKLLRRLHPEWDEVEIGWGNMRVARAAKKLGKKIREDLDRGVSESLILEHLPDAAREQFGLEMREEARKGQRLGVFAQRVKGEIEERQARIVEDAVRVQTGLDAENIENAYGINLSETLMHLAKNPLAEKPPQTAGGVIESGTATDEDGSADDEKSAGEVEIDAKVKAVVDDIVSASRDEAERDVRNREDRRAAAGRDAERSGDEGSASGDSSTGDGDFEGDALAAAVKKASLDLENPRHLARLVAELARRKWIQDHGLAQNAEVWRDLVAVQFLRKTAQSVYAKLVRDLTYSRSRETAMGRIAKLDNVPTVAGLLSEMEFLGALVNAQRIRETQKEMCKKLDRILRQKFGAQGRFKPDKEEGKRKVSAEAELRAKYMLKCMWFTPDAAAEEARQLQETLDALSVDFKDAGRDVDQSREFVETIRKLNVLREFGALRYKPVGEIEAATKWWENFARGESDAIVREMLDRDIRTGKAAYLLAVAFADPKRKTAREGGKADALNRFITGHMGFISLLQDCMRHASDADAAAAKDIIDYIAREIQKSGDRSEAEKRRHNDAFHSAVESIYGKGFNAVMKDMMAPDERFAKFMGVVGGKRVTPTKGRAMQLLVSLLQEGRKVQVEVEDNPGKTRTVWKGGYHDNIVKNHREGQADEIMKLLTPADMNTLKWLGQWYENNRSDLSQVCHSLFGIGVYAELPNYFPVKMQLATQGLEKGQGVGWTIFPKALTPRVRNERDFDTSADIFSMWAGRMEEAAQWKHHAQLGLELRGIFGRSILREAVRVNHGASVDELMQGFITDILAGHGAYDRSTAGVEYFSDQVRGWTALCALGGNVGVMLKQTTSMPAFGFEIGLVNTAKYMVNAFTPEGMAAMGKIWDSEQRRTRWNLGSSEAVRNALSQQNAGLLKRMFQASMITTKVGDVVPALVVGQGIYRDCLDRGMSEEDAMAETWSIVERTQQSGRMENQIQVQRRSKLGRIMFQFLSTQQQYLQYEVRAIREVIARPDSVKRWGSVGRAILLNHFILSSAYYWMGQLYKYALGQEPPEDELKDWVITCLLGPYGSLMVAGFMCKATLEQAIKGSYWNSPSMLPMESWIKTQARDAIKLIEAIFDSDGDTWDNMLEAAGRWMSDSNSVIRDLRKLYRFRVKEEPQNNK